MTESQTAHSFKKTDLFVAPNGNGWWSGRLTEPAKDGRDGPLDSIDTARHVIQEFSMRGLLPRPVTVWIRGGTYRMEKPVEFGVKDAAEVSFKAFPNEKPVFLGSQPIVNWSETKINGVNAWTAEISEHILRYGAFRSLFVNGRRAKRSCFPKTGSLMNDSVPGINVLKSGLYAGSHYFKAKKGDLDQWKNLEDAEIVARHFWTEERMPIRKYDPVTQIVETTRRSVFVLKTDEFIESVEYYIDNLFEAMTEPGEWYLDKAAQRVFYIPLEGEDMVSVEAEAPVTYQFLRFVGEPEKNRHVSGIRFEGVCFKYSDWIQPCGFGKRFDPYLPEKEQVNQDSYEIPGFVRDVHREMAAAPQAAFNLFGTIYMRGACHCAIENCGIGHIGGYGIDIAEGCRGNRVIGNDIGGMGGGGIKIDGATNGTDSLKTGNTVVTDNHIHDGGLIFYSGIGVAILHSSENVIMHNHIHHLFHSGISCGWKWDYKESTARDNRLDCNHIHHIGMGFINDMGGIYMLGVQPGTTLRGNRIHDVACRSYGGWGIYLDEGSSHMIVEENIIYNTSSESYNQHFGRENIVRNNIFVHGGDGAIKLHRNQYFVPFTLERNIIVTDGQPAIRGGYAADLRTQKLFSDLNCVWDISGREPNIQYTLARFEGGSIEAPFIDWDEWNRMGHDIHSVMADPKFRDIGKADFTIDENSPAFKLGFRMPEIGKAGIRQEEGERTVDAQYDILPVNYHW